MRLKNPGGLRAAIDRLETLTRNLAESLDGSDVNLQSAREAWLKWWAGADMALRALFADDDLLIPLARTAAEIRNLSFVAPAYEAPNLSLIIRERDVWGERLRDAVRELRQMEKFVMRPGRIAMLDTSAFHEFDRFWLADWARATEADPPYAEGPLHLRLMVPLLVVEELDAQKRHPNGKVREAARDILRHLRELPRLSTDSFADVLKLSERTTLEIMLDDPTHVRLPVNDAEIIDRAVNLRSLFPTERRVILVSSDLSMEFRAEGAGLETRHVSRDLGGDLEAG
jgi:hypothetical protein